jgi:DNA-binding Lrp family transcriptional regulator
MTQERVIKALRNGPLTSHEVANLTGMAQPTVLSTAKKLRAQGILTTEQVKVGRYWLAKYTLAGHEETVAPVEQVEEKRCLLNPFDLRNAKGIFSPAEYKAMYAHARRIYGINPSFASKSKVVTSEDNR